MTRFDYTIQDEQGIHVRPAGLLAKEAKKYESMISLEKDGKKVDVTRLMAVMGMGVKQGQTVTVFAEGSDEETAIVEMQKFFQENF